MKKSYQIIRDITVTGGKSTTITERLKEGYTRCVGAFVTPTTAATSFMQLTASLKIAQNEILPAGFDLSLIAFSGDVSMNECIFDFRKENIPARSSELEIVVKNNSSDAANSQSFNLYLILEND